LVEARGDEQANIIRSKALHACLMRLETQPKPTLPDLWAAGVMDGTMIVKDIEGCDLLPWVRGDDTESVVLVAWKKVYLLMANMGACLEALEQARAEFKGPFSCGEMRGYKFVRRAERENKFVPRTEIARATIPVPNMRLVVWMMLLSSDPIFVPMPDAATCEKAIPQTKDELNPVHVYCSSDRMPGLPNVGEPVAAILVLWGWRGEQNLMPMRTMDECERRAVALPIVDRHRVGSAFCRPAEPQERNKRISPHLDIIRNIQPLHDDRLRSRPQWRGWPANELK
jgi:hypothetical protein